jgi:hypothetical protein
LSSDGIAEVAAVISAGQVRPQEASTGKRVPTAPPRSSLASYDADHRLK